MPAAHLDAIANATRNASPEVRAAFATHPGNQGSEVDLGVFKFVDQQAQHRRDR